MATKTKTTSLDDIASRAATLTSSETARLAQAWRMQIGGGAAMARARMVAIEHQRDHALAELREAVREVGALAGQMGGERAEYEAAQARQCVREVMLAVSIRDLVGSAIDLQAVEILLAPWLKVIGPIRF